MCPLPDFISTAIKVSVLMGADMANNKGESK